MTKKYFISFVLLLITKLTFAQDQFLGEIRLFSGNFAPKYWAKCEGQLLPINQNQALFAILGTTYGGDGIITFALPDLKGRVAVGEGNNYVLGEKSGNQTVTITTSNIPSHQHEVSPISVNSDPGTLNVAITGSKIGNPVLMAKGNPRSALGYSTNTSNTEIKGGTTTATGISAPVNVQQPSLGLTYIIALQGIFPSRQ